MTCRPYYRNKTRYPSVVFPNTGDPDVDSRVYSFFVRALSRYALVSIQHAQPCSLTWGSCLPQEAGYTLVTLKPVTLPSIGTLDLGASHTVTSAMLFILTGIHERSCGYV